MRTICGLAETIRYSLEPFDRAMIGFFLTLNGLILIFHHRLASWELHFFKHLLFCLVIFAGTSFLSSRKGSLARFLRWWYPLMAIPFLYWNMGYFIHMVFADLFDASIVTLESAVFSVPPNLWVQQWVSPPATEIMQLFYSAYWLTVPAGAAVLYVPGSRAYVLFVHYVMLTFYVSFIVFMLLPVAGPRFFLAERICVDYEGLLFAGFLRRIVEEGGLRGAAFPSAHVAVALVVFRFMQATRPVLGKWVFLPAVTGLSLATVYGQYHYVTDVAAGIVLGLIAGRVGVERMRHLHVPTGSIGCVKPE